MESTTVEELWYGAAPESPSVDAKTPGIALALGTRPGTGGATFAFASWNLPGRRASELFGGRVTTALEIVAVDLDSGRVFHRSADRRPLTTSNGGEVPVQTGHVNADLARHLRLPPERRNYAVFLWLDELVSNVRTFEANGDLLAPAAPPVITFERSPRALERGAFSVELAVRAGAAPTRLEGRVRAAATSVFAKGPVVATALGLRPRTHEIAWRRQTLPATLWEAGELSFELDPKRLSPDGPSERTHFVVLVRGALSNTSTLDEQGRK